MPRMHGYTPPSVSVCERRINDKNIRTLQRCSLTTQNAVKNADAAAAELAKRGHVVDRVLFVYVDDMTNAERLHCVTLSVDGKTLVFAINERGKLIAPRLIDVCSRKRLRQNVMRSIVDAHDSWRVYARNRSCFM